MITLPEARKLAQNASTLLDGRHGDPSRNASWIRERNLARIVIALIDRLDGLNDPVEIKL